MDVMDRVIAGSIPEPNSGCLLWLGAVYREHRNHQYGVFSLKNRRTSVHRAVFAAVHGPIPPGMIVRHKCDVCLCVNPDHLKLGTQADNVRDMMERQRSHHHTNPEANVRAALAGNDTMRAEPHRRARGKRHGLYGVGMPEERNGMAKLDSDKVAQILALKGTMTQRALGKLFGVHQGVIWRVLNGHTWKSSALRARAEALP